jgi:hypothetical protein
MPKEFTIQEVVDHMADQMLELRAEALANRTAAGIALGLIAHNSRNPQQTVEMIRQNMRIALQQTQIQGGNAATNQELLTKARGSLERMGEDLAASVQRKS